MKRHPKAGDNNDKQLKRMANSSVDAWCEKNGQVLNNGDYKKAFESWDICDYKDSVEFQEFLAHYKETHNDNLTDKEIYRKWYKYYKMK